MHKTLGGNVEQSIRWDDFRIAYQLSLLGSLSRTGELLGVNHSTVLRSVNRLEEALGLPRPGRSHRAVAMRLRAAVVAAAIGLVAAAD